MAIKPITSVAFNGNYNKLAFEGRKENKEKNAKGGMHISNTMRAIPLAAALTMAPLNVINAESYNSRDVGAQTSKTLAMTSPDKNKSEKGVVIDSKTFDTKEHGTITVNQISTDDDNSNFEKVTATYSSIVDGTLLLYELLGSYTPEKLSIEGTYDILGTAKYNYNVISDNGQSTSNFSYKEVIMNVVPNLTPDSCNDPNFLHYIENLIKSPKNNGALKETSYDRVLRPSEDGAYQNNSEKIDLWKKAVPRKSYGKLLLQKDVTDGNNNVLYTLGFYSLDDNDQTAEVITLKDKEHPELEIFKAYIANHNFDNKADNPLKFQNGVIVLNGEGEGRIYIEDYWLAKTLYNMEFERVFGSNINYILLNGGVVAPSLSE